MEPTIRIELMTSSLPRMRSAELSYVGNSIPHAIMPHCNMERETRLELATLTLEG
jgi:hypothetical protein